MRKLALIFFAVALLVLPATALAHQGDGRKDAAKRCKVVASKDGRGHDRCKSERAREKRQIRRAALKSCKGEMADDVQAFIARYAPVAGASGFVGDEPEGSEGETPDEGSEGETPQKGAEGERRGKVVAKAFRKCVKAKVKAAKKGLKNAARTCRAERREDPEAFRAKYGANASKRNAFGKCVSKLAREGGEPHEGKGVKDDDDSSAGDDDEADDEGGEEPDDVAEPEDDEQEDLPVV